jgi:hypothetical protein
MGANLMDEGTTEFNNTHASPEKPHPSEFVEFVSGAPGLLEISKATANTQFETVHNAQTTLACDDVLRDFFSAIPQTLEPSRDAKVATDIERKMTFYNGCRLYPKAMAWSFLLSSTIIMEGYDTTLINSFYAFPAFRRTYGSPVHGGDSSKGTTYQISPSWQAALSNTSVAGEIVGLFLNGFSTDRFGYHWTMIGALVMMLLFVFPAFFAVNVEMILASQVLCGISMAADKRGRS